MTKPILHRNDVVGKKVVDISTSEWKDEDDGYSFCTYAYITLETGVVFSITMYNPELGFPPVYNLAGEQFHQEEFVSPELYRGQVIQEFVKTDAGSTGILLENGYVVFWGPCGITIYGPTIEKYEEVQFHDFTPFWPTEGS